MKKLLLLLFITLFSLLPNFSAASIPNEISNVHPTQEVVYVTKSGSKYHKESCHHLRKSKIKMNKSDAKSAGYSACSVCKP